MADTAQPARFDTTEFFSQSLEDRDPELFDAIRKERTRQQQQIELIASENIVSNAVLEAQGTVLTNKYAEGYPGKRYYGGCEFVDIAEELGIERAKKLFNCGFANVQPNSGSQANQGVFNAVLKPGDTILGMSLDAGGHLTHGAKPNQSGKWFNAIQYGVRQQDQLLDMDEIRAKAREHKPKLILAGGTAYSREWDWAAFREIADEIGAYLHVDMAHIAGLVAGGVHASPVPHAHVVTTTTHKTLRGPRGGMILCKEEYAKEVNKKIFPGIQGGPLMHVIAAKAVAFKEALNADFVTYQKQVIANAKCLAQFLIDQGYKIVSGGTDTHLMLVDLRPQDITGKDAEAALEKAGITVNKNTVPFETRSPFVTSGVRIGTPALTTRGMKENEMRRIGEMIVQTLEKVGDDSLHAKTRKKVRELCDQFPLHLELTKQ